MKIVNLCLCGPYNIGWGYQENLLSKYQNKNGHNVSVIASSLINDTNSMSLNYTEKEIEFDGEIKIIRLKPKFSKNIAKVFRVYKNLYNELENEKPDMIFIHGCQFLEIFDVCKYSRDNPGVKIKVDNHADFSNTAQTLAGKLINVTLWRLCAKAILPYSEKFYGVLPSRCDFLNKVYKIPNDKIELLVMGGDDDKIEQAKNNRLETREKLRINNDDFVVCSGGKIDKYKLGIIDLIEAVDNLNNQKIKLIIFGSINADVKKEIEEIMGKVNKKNILYLGWLNQDQIYDILCTSDLAFFPGRHSVLWEQSISCGTVSVFKYHDKMEYLNSNDNCIFIHNLNCANIERVISTVVNDENNYKNLKKNTEQIKKEFLYSNIAKKSLE